MKVDKNPMCTGRARTVCIGILLAFAIAGMSSASCVTEFGKIVKTAEGRVKGSRGEAIAGAQITVISSSDDSIFRTKSKRDGSFRLRVSPGKYRVEIQADGYLDFVYIVDLRSVLAAEGFDVPLHSLTECHDTLISSGSGGDTKESECSGEIRPANLILRTATVITGQVKDESGAPFKNSQIVLTKVSAIPLQPGYLFEKTDDDGAFRLDESEPGEYRLLASPNRGFAQPERLDCYEKRDCNLEIVLKANPSDLPFAGCPAR